MCFHRSVNMDGNLLRILHANRPVALTRSILGDKEAARQYHVRVWTETSSKWPQTGHHILDQ